MKLISTSKSPLKKGIACLAFSPDGKMICATAIDDSHLTAVYKFDPKKDKLKLLSKKKSGGAVVLETVWTGKDTFVTVGPKVYMYW